MLQSGGVRLCSPSLFGRHASDIGKRRASLCRWLLNKQQRDRNGILIEMGSGSIIPT
jgi:hypothetical protein